MPGLFDCILIAFKPFFDGMAVAQALVDQSTPV